MWSLIGLTEEEKRVVRQECPELLEVDGRRSSINPLTGLRRRQSRSKAVTWEDIDPFISPCGKMKILIARDKFQFTELSDAQDYYVYLQDALGEEIDYQYLQSLKD